VCRAGKINCLYINDHLIKLCVRQCLCNTPHLYACVACCVFIGHNILLEFTDISKLIINPNMADLYVIQACCVAVLRRSALVLGDNEIVFW
jgi:hypothetical protein